jgi:hypothetical protein
MGEQWHYIQKEVFAYVFVWVYVNLCTRSMWLCSDNPYSYCTLTLFLGF